MKPIALSLLLIVAAQLPATVADHLDQILREVEAIHLLLGQGGRLPPFLRRPQAEQVFVHVPSGGNLQAALTAATANTVVTLDPAAVYEGPVTCTAGTLQTQGFTPPLVVGTTPLAEIDPNNQQGLFISGACTVRGIEIVGNANDLIFLNPTANAVIEYTYLHGGGSTKNGITLKGTAIVRHNVIRNIYRSGQESHGIVSWEGGPYVITDNEISAASINVLFGGEDPSSEAVHPHDLTFQRNYLWKDTAWRGAGYAAKNLFELKLMKTATISDNTLEYSWVDGQDGWGLVVSVRNQSGTAPWSIIRDVVIEDNIFRHMAGGISWLGQDDRVGFPSERTLNVTIRNNVFEDISSANWGTNGKLFQINRGSENLTITGNQMRGGNVHSFLLFAGSLTHDSVNFTYTNNTVTEGRWGIIDGDNGTGFGVNALNSYTTGGYTWSGNTVERNPASFQPQTYPAGTTIVTP